MELGELKGREEKVKQVAKKLQKNGKLSRAALKVTQEKLRSEEFTAREIDVLQ